jgi:hypothetical protein
MAFSLRFVVVHGVVAVIDGQVDTSPLAVGVELLTGARTQPLGRSILFFFWQVCSLRCSLLPSEERASAAYVHPSVRPPLVWREWHGL